MKKIHRIVITGGPCAGKTTAFARIKSELSEKGYKVFVVSETFTDMFEGGIKLLDYPSLDFQSMLLRQQIAKEEMYYNAAIKHKNNKIVILYDRGVLDPIAYMDSDIASLMLELGGYKINELKARYDAVIHLVTAAEGAKEAFLANRANNTARYENVEQAIEADKKLLAVWTGHSHLRVIDNSTDFDRKITRLMEEIYSILGIPTPLEIERKFLIEMPDIKMLISKFNVSSSDIVQTYLCDNGGGYERRIRQRGKAGDYNYYYTEKRRISESVRLENDRVILLKNKLEKLVIVLCGIINILSLMYILSGKM